MALTPRPCTEAIRRAARICNLPIIGNLIGCAPSRLPLDFLQLIHAEQAGLDAAEKRKAGA